MRCCDKCFGDDGLRDEIFPQYPLTAGICDYCGEAGDKLLAPEELRTRFRILVSIYREDPAGNSLVRCLRDDWDLFRHPKMDDAHAKDLLAEILNDGEIVRKTFSPDPQYLSDRVGVWEELRKELMHENRFFLSTKIDLDRLQELLGWLICGDYPTTWYRARIQTGGNNYPPAEMGAPPKTKASHGRANPAGIPYLYLGSQINTAVSEVRPHTGEAACVAKFSIPDNLSLIDLRHPRRTISPFLLDDEALVGNMREDISFLERLGQELTRPVLPYAAAIDYLPSQYLCEYIKLQKYDGVIYSSSVSNGINLALFNPAKAEIGEITQHQTKKVSVEVE